MTALLPVRSRTPSPRLYCNAHALVFPRSVLRSGWAFCRTNRELCTCTWSTSPATCTGSSSGYIGPKMDASRVQVAAENCRDMLHVRLSSVRRFSERQTLCRPGECAPSRRRVRSATFLVWAVGSSLGDSSLHIASPDPACGLIMHRSLCDFAVYIDVYVRTCTWTCTWTATCTCTWTATCAGTLCHPVLSSGGRHRDAKVSQKPSVSAVVQPTARCNAFQTWLALPTRFGATVV